jgi:ATP-dependent DNA helicase RecQ
MTDLDAALHRFYGHEDFRPGQREAVRAAIDGRDVLVVMPTGAGKSLCYQLPALMRSDLTVVVSPLVSLMQDQVDGLHARVGADVVGLVNAQQDAAANREVTERAARGDVRLLYIAPERFSSAGFREQIAGVPIGLFVVDEAHCVSQWGHDFRPDYFRLGEAARGLGARSIVASTATATPQVAADIVARLGLRDPVRVSTGFDRPNLSFAVIGCASPADRSRRIVQALADPASRPAIVYAGTRRGAEEMALRLQDDLGIACAAYHAGLARERRADVQRRCMAGALEVVVATNAFGMGVDKADVRTVVHDGVPVSLEAYYQEAGRAGRDGAPAKALLFATGKDKGLHVFFIQRTEDEEGKQARWRQYRAVWSYAEGTGCRRAAILAHFGDRPNARPRVACCDVCAPEVAPDEVPGSGFDGPRGRRGPARGATPVAADDLDGAIAAVVSRARPSLGRTRLVEVLRGGRSKVLLERAYDGLPEYGLFDHLDGATLLARVDELLEAGRLESTGGMYPKLRVPGAGRLAA